MRGRECESHSRLIDAMTVPASRRSPLQARSNKTVEEILDAEAMQRRGGFPDASFVISMRPGYYTGGNFSGDPVTDFAGHGGHGFAPHHPEMRAALFIAGRGIARHRDLGQIDMRQVAPTVAALLGVKWSATATPLPVRQ